MGLEFRGEVWAREIMSYAINAWLILKAMKLDEVRFGREKGKCTSIAQDGCNETEEGREEEPETQMRNCVSRENPEIQGQNRNPRNRSQYLEKFYVQ